MAVSRRKDGAVGYVEINNPPVNAIGLAVRQGLLEAAEWAAAEGLERVILTGAGRVFAAGGDTKEFDYPPEPPHLPDVLSRIETSPAVWVACAHGAALGGGLEIMLACAYRIAAPGTKLGLPETTLGVVPGAGGTQRLPRLIGTGPALDMIVSGKPVSAEQALEMGLIDVEAEDPAAEAEMLNAEMLAVRVAVGDLPNPQPDAGAFKAARETAAKRMRGQTAPAAAVDLVELSTHLPLKEGMARERAAFIELRGSDQARALRRLFFAERAAGPGGEPAGTPAPAPAPAFSHVAVVGGGMMGSGIAYALLTAGLRVTVIETGAEAVRRAETNIAALTAGGLKRGVLSPEKAEKIRAAYNVTSDYAEAGGAGLAIEAAFESMEVKQKIFAQLQDALPADAVLATNTSYLDVNKIAASVTDSSRFLGLHFFAPAHIMKLLEIIRAEKTSGAALALGFDLAKRLRKIPVQAGVCDGFIGNRILARHREAADTLLADGAMPWGIDAAMTAFGYAMGPYEAQDLSGLDIAHANRRRQDAARDPARRYVSVADRVVDMGRLGRKTGAGWYVYPDGGGKQPDSAVEDLIREESGRAGVRRRDFSAEDIQHRLLHAMINEAADILHEGIAVKAADVDLVTVHGYGFPKWRGGLMHYADALGPGAVLAALRALAEEDPLVWRPSPVIEDCAARGVPFADWRRPGGAET